MYRSFLAVGLAGVVLGGLAGVASADRRAKTAVAVRTTGPITIDGRLDEATWTAAAAFVSDFAQKEPRQDAPPTERTEVAIAFDGDALYVAARMELADPTRLDRPVTRRDDTSGAERIIISFDPHRSRRTAYSFAVTAAGVRADWIHTDDSEYQRDHSWNPVWSAAVVVGADAWTAEMRIPFSQLRFPDDPVPVWGVNFNRYVPRTGEDDFWIVVPKDVTGWSSYFGELRGLTGIRRRLRLEILPYVAGSMAVALGPVPDDETVDLGGDAGLDLKLGLGPSLTLDATVNPDFGQVEADPAVVNLGAYEVIFPERRPFFVEGSQIFGSQPRSYFYSRRIGARDARILGAAKLTGQLRRRQNVGALAAVTAPAAGAPLAGWGVLRLEREVGADASLVGVTLTGVGRDLDDPALAAVMPEAAVTGGADTRLRFAGGEYEVFAAAGGSAVSGSPSAITAIQTSAAHYFQRPDATHLGVDPDARRIWGWHADLRGARRAGRWRFDAGVAAESPGLELNDVGILASADDLEANVVLARVETEPGRHLHSWEVTFQDYEEWSFDGTHKPAFTQVTGAVTLPSFLRVNAEVGGTRPGLSDDKTRGGPLMGIGGILHGGVAVNSSGAGPVVWGANLGGEWSRTELTGLGAGASVLWHASSQLRLQVYPSFRGGTVHRQYVGALDDTGGGADTFGTRYVFGALRLRELGIQFRTQLALSPDLTIDAYVEPFASSGRFDHFGELAAPRATELARYTDVTRAGGMVTVSDDAAPFTFPDPDFTFLSLRSTIVVRWELRPGSVLYAVWQQDRSGAEARARGLRDALGDSFTADGGHTVALKASYWWSP